MLKNLTEGSILPDFALPDENGTIHRLSELQGVHPMVLLIGRGEHCPRERQHQREMVKFSDWCTVAYTQVVTILPNSREEIRNFRKLMGADWTFLADENLEVQTALDIREYTDPIHQATVPHTLILAPGLVIDKIYVGYWFWGRPSAYDLWQDLRELSKVVRDDFDPTLPEVRAVWEAAQ